MLKKPDRFYFNQYFPISDSMLSEDFCSRHLDVQTKEKLLKELSKRKLELVGVVGRYAFHIFNKTNRCWVSSSEALAYSNLFEE